MQYTILTGSELKYLEEVVNAHIEKGWVPVGSVGFGKLVGFFVKGDHDIFIQAMTRSENKRKKLSTQKKSIGK